MAKGWPSSMAALSYWMTFRILQESNSVSLVVMRRSLSTTSETFSVDENWTYLGFMHNLYQSSSLTI